MKATFITTFCILLLSACSLMKEQKKFDARHADTSTTVAFTQTKRQEPIKPEWLKPSPKPFALGPGDKLEIEILGEKGTRADTFVTPDSKVYFDLLPGIDVKGKTTLQLREEM